MTATDQANIAVAELRRAYAAGERNVIAAAADDVLDWFAGVSGVNAQIRSAYELTGKSVEGWATTERDRAVSSGDWARWFARGKSIANDIAYQADVRANASVFSWVPSSITSAPKAALDSVKNAAGDALSQVFDVKNWPASVWLGVGFAGLLGVAWLASSAATITKAVKS